MLKQILAALFVLQALASGVVNADGPVWSRHFDDAQKTAKSEGKDLFIVFTGHGWCHACELLDREVFQTTGFVDALVQKYVFLELDFNFADTPEDEKRESEHTRLREHYLAPAVPIAVLATADGVPFGIIQGYDAGSGPQVYLRLIAAAKKGRVKRDEAFSRAASQTGNARAKIR